MRQTNPILSNPFFFYYSLYVSGLREREEEGRLGLINLKAHSETPPPNTNQRRVRQPGHLTWLQNIARLLIKGCGGKKKKTLKKNAFVAHVFWRRGHTIHYTALLRLLIKKNNNNGGGNTHLRTKPFPHVFSSDAKVTKHPLIITYLKSVANAP